MYSASAQFHTAVFQNSPVERVLFRFADSTIFTNEDIHVGSGIKFMEAANLEEELSIGACPSSSLEATLMNYHGLLSGYGFGECEVSLAVQTSVANGDAVNANVVTIMRHTANTPLEICGYLDAPYIKINGYAPTAQPPFPVYSILTVGDLVYCFSLDGEVWAATWVDGQTWVDLGARTWDEISTDQWDDIQGVLVPITDSTFWRELNETLWDELATTRWSSFIVLPTFNAFMVDKFKRWAAARRGMSYNSDTLYEFTTAGRIECYEYVKLGKFRMTVPHKKQVKMISTTAYDKMTLFDVDAADFVDGLTYPITLGEIFVELCTFVGVDRATQTFINSTRSFTEAPAQIEGVTAREVLGWIAEAACSFARMTRDGEVELAWFGAEPVSIPMTQYFSIDVAEYSVAAIDKLQILNSQNDIGVIIGDGTNGYQIIDNPYLYGANDQQIRVCGVPIYNRLSAFASFSPVMATAVCDWSIQAGDIISVVLNGVTHTFPVYFQTITWNGKARVSYESSGNESRPVMDAVNRRVFNQNRAMHEITVSVDGLTSRISDTEGNVTDLQITAQGLSTRIGNAEGDISSLELTTRGLSTRIESAEGDIATLELTAQGLSTRIGNAEGDISSLELTVDSISLSVINGSESSTIKLMKDGIEVSSQNISFSGVVTFTDLSTSGSTRINGSNITTGTVSASRIDVNNLYVKHLNGADGTFSGTLNAASTNFSSLDAVNGICHIGGDYIRINGVEIGYTSFGYEISVIPTYSGGYGNVGIGAYYWDQVKANRFPTSSSIRYKKNILPVTDEDTGNIDDIRIVTYELRSKNDGQRQLGIIAEELAEVSPMLIEYEDGQAEGIDYSRLSVVAINELKKLRQRVRILEERVGG